MNTVGSGHATGPDAHAAGERAARAAVGGNKPNLLFVFAAPSLAYGPLLQGVREAAGGAPVVGCSTAGEFTDAAVGHDSVAVLALSGDGMSVSTGIGRGLRADQAGAVRAAMSHFGSAYRAARQAGFTHATCFVLTDGLAGNGEELVERIHQESSSLAQVVGGAAADAAKFEKTEILYGDAAESDAVVVASVFTRTPIGVGVQHGLNAATAPRVVTRAAGGTIFEIDGKPAFQAYQEFARSRGSQLDTANAGAFMIGNELGMVTPDGHKIRAPLKANPDGSLSMATEVPVGTAVCIMDGKPSDMIGASVRAAQSAVAALKGGKPAGALVFDCICRRIVLGDAYREQVQAIGRAAGGVPLAGWETYGEIALAQNEASGFHNSTSVVSIIPA